VAINSIHVCIRRGGLGWRWVLLDLDIEVASGSRKLWLEAQQAAESARSAYHRRITIAEKALTANRATVQPRAWH
jgi:hypothetical protein